MTTTLLASGEVLVAGGAVGDATPDAELYSPATGTWRAAARLNGARYWHTATRLQNGRVLVTGGFGNATSLASAELYDPATDAWARVASMAVPRYWHTATLLPDGVYGGSSRVSRGRALRLPLTQGKMDPVSARLNASCPKSKS